MYCWAESDCTNVSVVQNDNRSHERAPESSRPAILLRRNGYGTLSNIKGVEIVYNPVELGWQATRSVSPLQADKVLDVPEELRSLFSITKHFGKIEVFVDKPIFADSIPDLRSNATGQIYVVNPAILSCCLLE